MPGKAILAHSLLRPSAVIWKLNTVLRFEAAHISDFFPCNHQLYSVTDQRQDFHAFRFSFFHSLNKLLNDLNVNLLSKTLLTWFAKWLGYKNNTSVIRTDKLLPSTIPTKWQYHHRLYHKYRFLQEYSFGDQAHQRNIKMSFIFWNSQSNLDLSGPWHGSGD